MSLRTQTDTGQTTTVSSATSFLLVVCGETYLALPAGLIRGIIKWDDADKAAVLERLAARTRVMDLAERLGLPSISSSEARILVCGGNSVCRAFLVTAIVGLEDIESAMITPLLPHFTGLERQWFSGMFLFREAVALVLDPGWLLSRDSERGEDLPSIPVIQSREEIGPVGVSPDMAARQLPVEITQFDLLELEEATDADDIPWAQL